MVSFLPDTVRGNDGSLTVDFGAYFPNAALVLKRTVFDGMKQEEEEITIEVKIQRLMAKTMAAATAPTPRTTEEVSANVAEWKALGEDAVKEEPDNYPYADCSTAAELTDAGFDLNATTIGKDVCLISFDTFDNSESGARTFPNVQTFEADLPSLVDGTYAFGLLMGYGSIQTFKGQFPNVQNATGMFQECTGLTEWTVELPNSLQNASQMFSGCTSLTSWNVALPNSITNARSMFNNCSGLTSWNGTLSNSITDATAMFSGCSRLTSWTLALPDSITNAYEMFSYCTSLTSWNGTLSNSITDAYEMFYNCTGLTSFASDMPTSLTKNARYMFKGCKLDITSVERISRTIQPFRADYSYESNAIHLGVSQACHNDSNFQSYIDVMTAKGWDVVVDIH